MGNSNQTHQIYTLFKNMGDYNSIVLSIFSCIQSKTFDFNFCILKIVNYIAWHFVYFFLLLLFY